ncbi:MAG: glycogen/starch synthase [Candidatus Omnitrophota bacterium]
MVDENITNLAAWSKIYEDEFHRKFLARELVLSHDAINLYIKQYIEKRLGRGRKLRQRHSVITGRNTLVISIPGLLKKTGQFAHVGLGRQYGEPVVYVDARIFNDKSDFEEVMRHERDEVTFWENFKKSSLGVNPDMVRAWIAQHMETPDTSLAGAAPTGEPYSTLTARDIARIFHENSYPLSGLYAKYKNTRFDFGYLRCLVNRVYGEAVSEIFYDHKTGKDLNIGAGGVTEHAPSALGGTAYTANDGSKSWIHDHAPDLVGKTMASLSMEGHIPELVNPDTGNTIVRDVNMRGGLGVYQGDKLEALSDIGVNAFGAQPGYCYGRDQWDAYKDLIKKGILEPVFLGAEHIRELETDGIIKQGQFRADDIKVYAWGEDPVLKPNAVANHTENVPVSVSVYKVRRGGTWVYLLLSNVFDELYTSNRLHRYTQEIVFGKAAYRLLKEKLGIAPDILHLNEAHTVVAAAKAKSDPDNFFDGTAIIYTNHTLVPEGLEAFVPDDMLREAGMSEMMRHDQVPDIVHRHREQMLNRMMYQVGIPESRHEHYRTIFLSRRDHKTIVDYCYAAFQLADVINAVSAEHAIATEKLFKALYPDRFDRKVVPILNGSGKTWIYPELLKCQSENRVPSEEELRDIHERAKKEALDYVEKETTIKLDPSKPTVWAVRRITGYKSQYPLLRFIVYPMCASRDEEITKERLIAWWDEHITESRHEAYDIPKTKHAVLEALFPEGTETIKGLGMQLVLGGPGYEQNWVQNFIRWSDSIKELRGKVVFVRRSSPTLLRMQALGADICVNMPQPLMEACGTSDQRSGLNGGVNVAIEGAGPVEWMTEYDDRTGTGCGFFIGPYTKDTPEGPAQDLESFYINGPADLYAKFRTCSAIYYHEPDKWKRIMHNSYVAATYGAEGKKAVTAKAMEQRYAFDVYIESLMEHSGAAGDVRNAEELSAEVDGKVYVIRYDRDRLSQELTGLDPQYTAEDIIQEYVKLIQSRVSNPANIITVPSSGNGLINVTCYRDASQSDEARIGTARINAPVRKDASKDEYYYLRIPALLNIAMSVASIRENIQYSDYDDAEKAMLEFAKRQYLSLTGLGLTIPVHEIMSFLRNLVLPEARPVPLEKIRQYNRFAKRLLSAA